MSEMEKVIAAQEPFMMDPFGPIPSLDRDVVLARQTVLRQDYEIVNDHMVAYSPSKTSLRRLTMEISERDLERKGAPIIERFASQLEQLELRIYDENWRDNAYCTHEEDAFSSVHGGFCINALRPWGIRKPLMAAPNLISLTIAATARGVQHFLQLAPHVPNLQELTLGIYWKSGDGHIWRDDDDGQMTEPQAGLATLRNLETLRLVGDVETIDEGINMLLEGGKSPEIRFLTLCQISPPQPSYVPASKGDVLDLSFGIGTPHLEGLALYGLAVARTARSMSNDRMRRYFKPFSNITVLVFQVGYINDHCPILDDRIQDRPLLPSVKRIIWVVNTQSRATDSGHLRDESDEEDDEEDDMSSVGSLRESLKLHAQVEDIRDLFRHYKTVEQIEWVVSDSCPLDPFAPDDPDTREARGVLYIFFRPADDDKYGFSNMWRSERATS